MKTVDNFCNSYEERIGEVCRVYAWVDFKNNFAQISDSEKKFLTDLWILCCSLVFVTAEITCSQPVLLLFTRAIRTRHLAHSPCLQEYATLFSAREMT